MNKGLKIVLGILFFPVTIYILIWKSKLSKALKITLTALWTPLAFCALFIFVGMISAISDIASGNYVPPEKTEVTTVVTTTTVPETVTTTEEVKTTAPETVMATEEVKTTVPVTTIETTVPETEAVTEAIKTEKAAEYSLLHGELISTITNTVNDKNVIVIKAKISPSYSNKATIDQNYFNIEDFVKNQNGSQFDEIQYWAVAAMTDGSEGKVISFTVNKDMINSILTDKYFVPISYGDYVEDLWILPSLK